MCTASANITRLCCLPAQFIVNVEKVYLLLEVVFQGVEVLFVTTHTFGFNPLKRNG
jgi:hypothetical protein